MPTIKLPKRQYNNERTTRKVSYQKIYQDRRYRLMRVQKLIDNPLCERCAERGIVKQADEVHHKIPFDWGRNEAERQAFAFDYENLISVCMKCHDELHEELEQNKVEMLKNIFKDY